MTEIQFIPPAVPQDIPLSAKDLERLESAMTGDHPEGGEWCRLHPGEVLLKEFLEPLGLSRRQLARNIHVSPRRIGDLVRGKSAATLDTGLRFAHYFCTAEDFRLRAQMDYDLNRALGAAAKAIKRRIKPRCPPK